MGDNAVFVVLHDTLTRRERTLVGAGESEAVLDGFMSDNHIDPDIAVEMFILEPLGADPGAQAAIAVAEPAGG